MQRTKEKNNMRIHPRLKENVELNPTKESSQENLDLLCQKLIRELLPFRCIKEI